MFETRIRLGRPIKSVRAVDPSFDLSSLAPVAGQSPAASQQAAAAEQARAAELQWQQIQQVLGSMAEAIDEVEQRRQQSIQELRQAAVELAVEIASAIVQRQMDAGDFAIEKLVESAVAALDVGMTARLRMHPEDLALLNRRLEGRPPPWPNGVNVSFAADATLARGSCRVDTGDFGLLSTIEQRIDDIRQTLLENLESAEIERRQPEATDRSLRRFPDRRETA